MLAFLGERAKSLLGTRSGFRRNLLARILVLQVISNAHSRWRWGGVALVKK
jgi:hypothetical protein